MNPIILAIPVFILTIVCEFAWAWKVKGNMTPDREGKTRQIYSYADTMASLKIGILSRISGAFPRLLTLGIYVAVYDQFAQYTWNTSNPWAWIIALLMYDFFYYWKHRANHEVRIMWAGHITHHNSEYFNLSTALRQASTTFVFDWIFYLPMAVLGVPWQMFLVVGLIDLLYQYWVHTELIGKLGWFDRIFVSPSNHRVHHGQDDYCIDKNYGGILVVWDRLFGTFVEEQDEPISYGVRTALKSFNPLWGNWHYYTQIWTDFKAAKGISAKLVAVFGPPSGFTGEKLEAFNAAAFSRYDVTSNRQVQAYVLVQTIFNVIFISAFLYAFPKLSLVQGALAGFWMTAAVVAPMALLEGKPWGRWLEVARWAALAVTLFIILFVKA